MESNALVCLCYANQDEPLMREFERHLQVLEQQGAMTLWHRGMVGAGGDWQQEVRAHLDTAHAILFLVSAHFLSSDSCRIEIQQAMERYYAGVAQVIPVILKPVLWRGTTFRHLKVLPHGGKPVTSSAWSSYDEALIDVAEGVLQAVEGPTPILAHSSIGATPHANLRGQAALPPTPADVFLCHNSFDKPEVKKIGEALKLRGIRPWLDEWELRPGLPSQQTVQREIARIPSAAVFVGKSGIGPWQNMETDAFLAEFVWRGCPVIPVLLRYAPTRPPLPPFLRNMTWVDFRSQDPDPLNQLIWGITGKKPDVMTKSD